MLWYDARAQRTAERFAYWDTLETEKGAEWYPLPRGAARALQKGLAGSLVLPGDDKYNADRKLANPKFDFHPQAICYCLNAADVRLVLQVCAEYGLHFVVRAGGHSTAGFSGTNDVILDVSDMNAVTVVPDPVAPGVWIESGAEFGDINANLEMFGYHLQGGACPNVHQGGYMQGGGYGWTARMYGMHCDAATNMMVMLFDGTIVMANERSNADLFWAMRGGTGNNFGVLLSTYYPVRVGDLFCGYSIRFNMQTMAREDLGAVLTWLQENYALSMSDKIGTQGIWVWEGPEGTPRTPWFLLRGMYDGTYDAMLAELAPVLALPRAELQYTKEPTKYSELTEYLLSYPYEVPQFPKGITPFPPAEDKVSRIIERVLAPGDWAVLLDHFLQTPNPYTILAMEFYGGAINAHPTTYNAWVHRDGYCDTFLDVFWLSEDEKPVMLAYLEAWKEKIAPMWDGHAYQNYPQMVEPAYWDQYFGSNYPGLQRVKAKYDPENVFAFPQGIVADPCADGVTDPALCEALAAPIARVSVPE